MMLCRVQVAAAESWCLHCLAGILCATVLTYPSASTNGLSIRDVKTLAPFVRSTEYYKFTGCISVRTKMKMTMEELLIFFQARIIVSLMNSRLLPYYFGL